MGMQIGGLLARLESCLDTLEAVSLPAEPLDEVADEKQQFSACCAILQQAADHASTSDFIRQVGLDMYSQQTSLSCTSLKQNLHQEVNDIHLCSMRPAGCGEAATHPLGAQQKPGREASRHSPGRLSATTSGVAAAADFTARCSQQAATPVPQYLPPSAPWCSLFLILNSVLSLALGRETRHAQIFWHSAL